MDVDEPKSTVISDSEAADEEISIIYRPEFDEDYLWGEERAQETLACKSLENIQVTSSPGIFSGESVPPPGATMSNRLQALDGL